MLIFPMKPAVPGIPASDKIKIVITIAVNGDLLYNPVKMVIFSLSLCKIKPWIIANAYIHKHIRKHVKPHAIHRKWR